MGTKNALEILNQHIQEDSELKEAYLEEKRKYQIACKIRECRKHAKMTQKQLAKLIGTKQSVISRLENADYTGHSLTVLKKIAKALNEPLENFLEPEVQNSRVFTVHVPNIIKEAASFKNWKSNQVIRENLMLGKDWLATCAPVGALDQVNKSWNALGAGVFVFDDPYIWYVTAKHIVGDKPNTPLYVMIGHAKEGRLLIDLQAIHKQHKIDWVIDQKDDLAATLFPANPDFLIKAISFSSFIKTEDMIPSMTCYSVGCPYSLAGFDVEKMIPCVLDGIISGINPKENRIYVTVPTFPGNSGGPLFVWKEPIDSHGGVSLGGQVVFLGGIISQYLLIQNGQNNQIPLLHLGSAIPADTIEKFLLSSKCKEMKQKAKSSKA